MSAGRGVEAALGVGSLLSYLVLGAFGAVVLGLIQLLMMGHHIARSARLFEAGWFDMDALTYDPATFEALGGTVLPPWVLAVGALVQNAGMLTLAGGLLWLTIAIRRARVKPEDGAVWRRRQLREGFAWVAPSRGALAAGLLGGLSVSFVSGGLLEVLIPLLPELDSTTAQLIGEGMQNASGAELLLLVPTLTIIVPIAEELLFRGYAWDLFRRWLPGVIVGVLTSTMFAAIHFSPLHILGVAPAALLFGWLRLNSPSVGPSIVAHVVNNGLAVGAFLVTLKVPSAAEAAEGTPAWPGAVVGLVVVVVAMWLSWRSRPQPSTANPA